MPPKAKITKEMIVDAAFALARREGAEAVNARAVAGALGCSTQPVMYHFPTMEALKKTAYDKADQFHTDYLLQPRGGERLLGMGLSYIRFAVEEPHLFRFLFQSGYAARRSAEEIIGSQELAPVLGAMREAMGVSMAQATEIFWTIALFAHGYASLAAGGALAYDERQAAAHLRRAYRGAALAAQEARDEEAL